MKERGFEQRPQVFFEPASDRGGHSEIIFTPELDINGEAIWNDNHSDRADSLRDEFTENRHVKKNLAFTQGCVDARRRRARPTRTYHYDTIAAAGDPIKVIRAIESDSVEFVENESHHGPELPGKSPTECGGRDAKAQQMKNGNSDPYGDGLGAYITNEVRHFDVILNGFIIGARTAKLTEKPVAVTTQNHRTGEKKLIAVIQRQSGKTKIETAIDHELIYREDYSPEEMYADGIPFLDINAIENEVVAKYMRECQEELDRYKKDHPNYEGEHILHNPDMMLFTTDLRSRGIILPGISSRAGSIVRLTSPRGQKIDKNHHVRIAPSDIQTAWAQAEYVVTNATEHFDDLRKSFSKMKTIFVATSNYDQARDIMANLMGTWFMQRYLLLPNRRLFVGQTRAGVITKIGKMAYDMKNRRIANIKDTVLDSI